jgi:hypothetical protein
LLVVDQCRQNAAEKEPEDIAEEDGEDKVAVDSVAQAV